MSAFTNAIPKKVYTCPVVDVINAMDKDSAVDFKAALGKPKREFPHVDLVDAIATMIVNGDLPEGMELTTDKVGRHRLGKCRCRS